MKALIIHPFLGSHYKAVLFSEMAKIAQGNEKLELHVIQMFENEDSRRGMEYNDKAIHQYSFETLFNSDLSKPSFISKVSTLIKAINKFKPDAVNVTGYYDWAVNLIMIYLKLKGVRVFMSIDSTLMDQKNTLLKKAIKSLLLFWPDGFFCYGSKSVELITYYGRKNGDALVVKNAVPNKELESIKTSFENSSGYEHWRTQFPKQNFVFIGRLIPEKNIKLLIQAFQELDLADWGLIIIGSGILENELKNLAKSPNVFFEGGKSWREVPQYFSASDALVLPSVSEPWGLVVNEAMACSIPVIVSDACGSTFDLVKDRNTGLSFQSGNIDDLKKAMTNFALDKKRRKDMARNAKELIKNYDPKLLAEEMWQGFMKFA